MYLGNVPIKNSTSVSQSIVGNFISPNRQDLIIIKGSSKLELVHIEKLSSNNNYFYNIEISLETFSHIRKITKIKDTYTNKDNIIVLSDSGKLVIFEIDINKKKFISIYKEIYGKSGCRRVTPGEYLAVDNKNRAIMIGAIEKEKFVYIFKDNDTDVISNNNKKIISSPLEVFNPQYICYDLVNLDEGFSNPVFASIEVKYNSYQDWEHNDFIESDENSLNKILFLYEVEIRNNYVAKLLQHQINKTAYKLLPIHFEISNSKTNNNFFKDNYFYGCLLVFCKGFISFLKTKENQIIINKNINIDKNKNEIMIINDTTYSDIDKKEFCILMQSQYGDIYQIIINYNENKNLENFTINNVFKCNTASTLSILDNNILFMGRETSDSEIYSITNNNNKLNLKSEMTINSLNALIDFKYLNSYQKLYSISGNKESPLLKTLNIKTSYNFINSLNQNLPANPLNIWTLKKNFYDNYDSLIIFSFVNKTLVYLIEENSKNLKEFKNCNFETKSTSLYINILKDSSFLQVLPNGILHIKTEKKTTFLKSSSLINCANSTNTQLIIGLENKELLYFEFDTTLNKPEIKVIGEKISFIEFCPVNENNLMSKYVAICINENNINILSLEKDKLFFLASSIKIPDDVSSIKILQINKNYTDNFLAFVGLKNGVLVIINFNKTPGNTQFQAQIITKFIGENELKLFKLNLNFDDENLLFKYYDSILITDNNNNYICKFDEKNDNYIDYSFRKVNIKENINLADNCYFPLNNKKTENVTLLIQKKNIILGKFEYENLVPKKIFKLKSKPKSIIPTLEDNLLILENNCIQIINIKNNKNELLDEISLKNESIISFHLIENYCENSDKQLLLLGVAENYNSYPIKKYSKAFIYLFDIYLDIKNKYLFTIKQKIKTETENIPMSICEYQNKILSGTYSELIMYEIGKEHLLKKSRSNIIKDDIISLSVYGDRILCATCRSSIYILKYNEISGMFYLLIADDFYSRYIHKVKFLDYDTIAGTDKFENFFVYRIPKIDTIITNNDNILEGETQYNSVLHGANKKFELINEIHIGEIITEFQTITLKEEFDDSNSENSENEELNDNKIKAILYGTISGGVGLFIQFNKREDALFFAQLELLLREYVDEPTGRNILMSKSQYIPIKNIIDFNLIYEFFNLDNDLQKKIGEELGDKPVNEVKNKIAEIRNLCQ